MHSMIWFIAMAAIYAALKIILEKRLAPMEAADEDRDLADVAFASGCSVFALFQRAGAVWNFSRFKIENDFKAYLNTGQIPGYLRQYVRRQSAQVRDRTYSKLIYSGGRPPYL